MVKTAEERFWAKVDQRSEDECWNWTACTFSDGYGAFKYNDRLQPAHRVAYQLTIGRLHPFRKHNVLRTCGKKLCCNPKHFKIGSLRQAHEILGLRPRDLRAKGKRYLTARQKRRIQERALRGDCVTTIKNDYPNTHYNTVLRYVREILK